MYIKKLIFSLALIFSTNQVVQAGTILDIQKELQLSLKWTDEINTQTIQDIIKEKIDGCLWDDVNAIQSMLKAHLWILLKKTNYTTSNKIAEIALSVLKVPTHGMSALSVIGMVIGLTGKICEMPHQTLEPNEKLFTSEVNAFFELLIIYSLELGCLSLPFWLGTLTLENCIKRKDDDCQQYETQLQQIDALLTYITIQKALATAQTQEKK